MRLRVPIDVCHRRTGRDARTLWALGLAVVLCLVGTACEPAAAPQAEAIRPVRTMRVAPTQGGRPRTYAGVAEASIESRLSFRVSGEIIELPLSIGDSVRAGGLVARLDPTGFQLELDRAQAALAQAAAQQRNAEASFERVRELYENQNAARNDYDAALALSQSAAAGVESARAQLELARQRLEYTTLRSTVSGAIVAIEAERNENVSAGRTVVILASGSQPQISVSVPENLIAKIRRGDVVQIQLDALGSTSFPGRVWEVAVSATSRGTTFPVTVTLDQSLSEIRSGMAAEVTFRVAEETTDQILVPSTAVLDDGQQQYVFVVVASADGRGSVHRRAVQVAPLPRADGIEILAGLEVGDVVVTAGASRLVDGQQVRLPQD